MRTPIRAAAFLFMTLALAACSSGSKPSPTPTTPVATSIVSSASPTATSIASEAGQEPIFWRTSDGFAGLEAAVPYKVIFRVTNGYAEPTLAITAAPEGGGISEQIEAEQVQPGGGDAPGSYYAVNITIPRTGRWLLTVTAGADQAEVHVEVAPGAA
jgi:hypothetical protein